MADVEKIAVLGGGSWGTAVANLLATSGMQVVLWARESEVVEGICQQRENPIYHPGVSLSAKLTAEADLATAIKQANHIIIAIPTQFIRKTLVAVRDLLPHKEAVVSISKGIENQTLMTVSQLLADMQPKLNPKRIACLSGPSFAAEVLQKKPTAVLLACKDLDLARDLQQMFHVAYFRTYISDDILGAELGGALKNVIAIGVGVLEGLGFGHNTRAALITRAVAEISRLAVKMGAKQQTLSGLAGAGDLILTCTGDLSRNRSLGLKIGGGERLEAIQKETPMVAEGVATARSAYQLAKKHNVEMPIVEQVYLTLHNNKPPTQALQEILNRAPKEEFY